MRASYTKYAALRDKRMMTDYAVAKQAGLTTASISNWKATEDGRQAGWRPGVDKLSKIASVLNCSIEDLLTEDE